MAQSGNVEPITIVAYSDKKLQHQVGAAYKPPINPEQYSQNYKIELDTSKGHGNQGSDIKYKATAPEQLQLEFRFDNTGAVMGNTKQGTSIRDQVKEFLGVVYDMHGDIHQPKYLKIFWGSNSLSNKDHAFDCIATNLDIDYILFDRHGEPLRAKIKATFLNYIEQVARVAREDKGSPDLTKVNTIKDGDRLPLLTFEKYTDQSYYLKVAKFNNLTTFRKLKVGGKLFFPPIEKNV